MPARSTAGRDGVGTGFRPYEARGASSCPATPGAPSETARSSPSARPPTGTTDTDGPTYEELYEKAKQHNIKGRSKMSKTELERALGGR